MANVTLGPTGGEGGKDFAIYSIPADAKLREIHVYAFGYVDALQLKYEINGDISELPRIGGHSGLHHAFVLDADEYLVGVSGRSGDYIDSIRFHTNKRTSDSFGGWGGSTDFSFEAPAGGEIAGFFGRADWYIDALGVLIRDRKESAAEAASPAPAASPTLQPASKKKAPAKAAVAAAVAPAQEAKKAPAKSAAKAATTEAAAAPAAEPKAKAAAKPAVEPKAKAAAKPAKASAPAAETRAATIDLGEAKAPQPDDLIKVEGIGPKIAGILIENGVLNLSDLAATPVEKLRAILDAAGSRYKLADPTTWPQQAALGAAGDWAAFDALQKSLKAGRKE